MKIQSYVDLITNSSTSVFQFADSPEGVKTVIDAVLIAGGSELSFDDLFTISVEYDVDLGDASEYYTEQAEENRENYPELDELLVKRENANGWQEANQLDELIYQFLINNCGSMDLNAWAKSYNEDSWDYRYSSHYVINPKNPDNEKEARAIEYHIGNLYSHDACYC